MTSPIWFAFNISSSFICNDIKTVVNKPHSHALLHCFFYQKYGVVVYLKDSQCNMEKNLGTLIE